MKLLDFTVYGTIITIITALGLSQIPDDTLVHHDSVWLTCPITQTDYNGNVIKNHLGTIQDNGDSFTMYIEGTYHLNSPTLMNHSTVHVAKTQTMTYGRNVSMLPKSFWEHPKYKTHSYDIVNQRGKYTALVKECK